MIVDEKGLSDTVMILDPDTQLPVQAEEIIDSSGGITYDVTDPVTGEVSVYEPDNPVPVLSGIGDFVETASQSIAADMGDIIKSIFGYVSSKPASTAVTVAKPTSTGTAAVANKNPNINILGISIPQNTLLVGAAAVAGYFVFKK